MKEEDLNGKVVVRAKQLAESATKQRGLTVVRLQLADDQADRRVRQPLNTYETENTPVNQGQLPSSAAESGSLSEARDKMTAYSCEDKPLRSRSTVDLVPIPNLPERVREVHDLIARRAYELYESRGREAGHAVEDWLRAESEVLCPVPYGYLQTQRELTLDICVSGFNAEDLRVMLEPSRVIISGKRPAPSRARTEKKQRPPELFRSIDLPVEVYPSGVNATLNNGILELRLPKVDSAKEAHQLKAA